MSQVTDTLLYHTRLNDIMIQIQKHNKDFCVFQFDMATNGCSISYCWPLLVAVAILLQQVPPCTCFNLKSSPFVPRRSSTPWKEDSMFTKEIAPTTSTTLLAKRTKEEKQNEKNPLTLVSWYAVEAFGKIFAPPATSKDSSDDETNDQAIDLTVPPRSLSETLARIELDFERSYFLSGAVDKLIYDPDCTFSDPFVSFNGRDRFVENLSNLGSFITKYSAKRLQYAVVSEPSPVVKTKVRLASVSRVANESAQILPTAKLNHDTSSRKRQNVTGIRQCSGHGQTRIEPTLEASLGLAVGCGVRN